MFAQLILALDPSRWELWLIAAAGLVAVGFVMLVGRTVFAGQQPALAPRATSATGYDPFLDGSWAERRASLRRRGRQVRVYTSNADMTAPPAEAWVIDRSTGGLCLASAQALPVGTVVSVRPCDAPTTIPWLQLEVRNAREQAEGWEIGCAFLRTPPWGILLHFG